MLIARTRVMRGNTHSVSGSICSKLPENASTARRGFFTYDSSRVFESPDRGEPPVPHNSNHRLQPQPRLPAVAAAVVRQRHHLSALRLHVEQLDTPAGGFHRPSGGDLARLPPRPVTAG